MDSPDGGAWVFDSLVGFLHGPVWNIPLQSFIEEKSLPFEPTDNGEVLDRPEYKKIHDEYKNLVDVMLGSFMDDIGITAEQFEGACRMSARDLAGLPAHFHRRLFEQIWAANDYDIFVKMMTHKNVELQLQALELIERRFGTIPNLFSSEPEELDTSRSSDSEGWSDKDDVMMELKKLCLEDSGEKAAEVQPEIVVAEKQLLLTKLQSYAKNEDKPKLSAAGSLPVESVSEPVFAAEAKAPPKKIEVTAEELRVRQEYLKQQRDKLLALKRQVRERRLGEADATGDVGGAGVSSKARPRSARVAAAALAGEALPSTPASDALQLRRALATKLKTEVVDTNV